VVDPLKKQTVFEKATQDDRHHQKVLIGGKKNA